MAVRGSSISNKLIFVMQFFDLFLYLFWGLFAMALIGLFTRWRHYCFCFILWLFIPFFVPLMAKHTHLIRRRWIAWLLVLFSPLGMILFWGLWVGFNILTPHTPKSIQKHPAFKVNALTGVDLPKMTMVDSVTYYYLEGGKTPVLLVPQKPLSQKDFQKIDSLSQKRPQFWAETNESYRYYIDNDLLYNHPSYFSKSWTVDRAQYPFAEHIHHVKINIPLKGDTIQVTEYW